jgi:hypothetical protein
VNDGGRGLVRERKKCAGDIFRFLRHNEGYESVFCRPADEAEVLADLTARSRALGATLTADRATEDASTCAHSSQHR